MTARVLLPARASDTLLQSVTLSPTLAPRTAPCRLLSVVCLCDVVVSTALLRGDWRCDFGDGRRVPVKAVCAVRAVFVPSEARARPARALIQGPFRPNSDIRTSNGDRRGRILSGAEPTIRDASIIARYYTLQSTVPVHRAVYIVHCTRTPVLPSASTCTAVD